MLLQRNSRRLLLMASIPVLLVCVAALLLVPGSLSFSWTPLVISLTLVLCMWADGRADPARRMYRRFGMVLTAPFLALWLVMATGIYLYQGPTMHLRFGNGTIQMHFGSTAALAPSRIPLTPPWHTSLFGNWSRGYTHGWLGVPVLALVSLEPLISAPEGWSGWAANNLVLVPSAVQYAVAPVGRYNLPVTVLLVLTVLPTLMLTVGRNRPPATPGICEHCQYSLTGNTSGVCPECGAKAPPRPAAK